MVSDSVPGDSPGDGISAGDGELGKLIAEAVAAPVTEEFPGLAGRITEDRPGWDYPALLAARMAAAAAALDIQTGDGAVLAGVPYPPPILVATTASEATLGLARRRAEPLGAAVGLVADAANLPYSDQAFDLVTSRNPSGLRWPEVARVLVPGGICLSQQVGAGSHRELAEFLTGSPAADERPAAQQAAADAQAAGLEVTDLREQALRVEFLDVGAIVWFLRTVPSTVPDFTVEQYAGRLADLHRAIEADGSFGCYARRFLIEARKPVPDD